MSTPIYNKIITQIYEIQTPYEAEMLSEIGVDHIGSVLTSERPVRQPLLKETIETVKRSASKSSLIPLFSDIDSISYALDYYKPDIVHFCEDIYRYEKCCSGIGSLIDLQQRIKERFPGILVMRSIPIPQEGGQEPVASTGLAKIFESVSDFFLTDTVIIKNSELLLPDQPVNGFVGITGLKCDFARKFVDSTDIPVILAGGLSPENVFDGIMKVKPAGVDSCTNTNARDVQGNPVRFEKDIKKVEKLLKETERAQKKLADSINRKQYA
jgi:phosphoribosylanthranilate isomerase